MAIARLRHDGGTTFPYRYGRQDAAKRSTKSLTNGRYLNYAMLYHDSVAFLISNDLGIPQWMAAHKNNNSDDGTTPDQVAERFNLSRRAASALLVTLCRMGVVNVHKGSGDSVDDIRYVLTPSADLFLARPDEDSYFGPFANTLHSNFMTPEKLLEACRPVEQKDTMSEFLEEDSEEVELNARHFMKHMNAQSFSCAQALSPVLGLDKCDSATTMLDVGGGSAIYSIAAARSNPLVHVIVYELPNIKAITESYIAEAGLSDQIKVEAGRFLYG